MKATTDEDLREAIDIIDEVSFPHPDQQWAIEQLICSAHALGILKLRQDRLRSADLAPSGIEVKDAVDYLTMNMLLTDVSMSHFQTLIRAAQSANRVEVVTVSELMETAIADGDAGYESIALAQLIRRKYPYGILIKPDAEGDEK